MTARSPWATQPHLNFLSFLVDGQQTDKDLLQPRGLLEGNSRHKKNYPRLPRSQKKPPKNGLSGRQFGKYISPRCGAFLVRNSTCQPPMPSSRQTFFFCLMTNFPEGARFTSTRSPLPKWPGATSRPNPSLQKILMRLRRPSRRFTSDRLSCGQKLCRSIPGANSWGL